MTAEELLRGAAPEVAQAEVKLLIDLPNGARFTRLGKAGHGVYTVTRNAKDATQDIQCRHASGFTIWFEPWESVLPV